MILGNKGAIGCALSHLNIVKQAKLKYYNNILILEDDIKFIINKDTFYLLLNRFFTNIKDWNLLIFDTCGNIQSPWSSCETNINGIYKINNSFCTGGYIINSNFFDIFIESIEKSTLKLINEGFLFYEIIEKF